jgi:hypothetical protein
MFETIAALLGTAAAIGLAYWAWLSRKAALGWSALLVSIGATWLWCGAQGAEIGLPLAIETGSLIALCFIVTRIDRRPERAMRERHVEPPVKPRRYRLRGALRALVAGPLGLAAAMGIAVAIALKAPMVEQTRLILAGLIVPSLWAICIIWSIATRRLARTAAGLALAAIAGFALAVVPKG